ncbi:MULTISPECIES: 4-(cytidine 5'-diphospho)-2-C-methyl-D-erythritol kinase [unclassified Leisingera]|uniref:4-(cytidine 5'-diphospho)-2-C-methyl-D-erythritol kinase n=1 Tax=unclassified Leisingera TaxID=2614906 RepID=UPI00057CDD4E|nr:MULTISPECIES: 4-(cytidine 5'-diphospho)-2-C-methyl-D-erythritol kinase [unclassified Leisingera]KIC16441.1 4-diphosphocytidyl-2C-methyl-D-erythritol kinase [Leisingera sp. ANG-DT]KIC31748.1 4-diphosphocytidyl-2C-methyl-D-erythritol kinase [Leisingera sp. ANG-S5]
MAAEVAAPAKINLTLHVTGRREDGYHLLDSLVVFADTGDRLRLEPGQELSLQVSGLFAAGVPADERNLVWRAAAAAGWTGKISLDKQLPHGAGIGGGSSDAAAALRAIASQGGSIPEELPLKLGADVPVCMAARASRMRGIGEQVMPVDLPDLHALLVNPGAHVPTGAVFSALASRYNAPMPQDIPAFTSGEDCAAWLAEQRNDLEVPAITVAPEIGRVLSDLRSSRQALLARMSGSGATCFALYPTKKAAHMAAYEIGAEHPEWWCSAVTLT